MGPGSRCIPALVISPFFAGQILLLTITQYNDTTSILATIERRFGLAPLSSRDSSVNDLSQVFDAKQFEAEDRTR